MANTPEQAAVYAAALAARAIIARSKNRRDIMSRHSPTAVGMHAGMAAVYAWQQAGGGVVGDEWAAVSVRERRVRRRAVRDDG